MKNILIKYNYIGIMNNEEMGEILIPINFLKKYIKNLNNDEDINIFINSYDEMTNDLISEISENNDEISLSLSNDENSEYDDFMLDFIETSLNNFFNNSFFELNNINLNDFINEFFENIK